MCCFQENLLQIWDFWSWKMGKKSWKGPWKVLDFIEEDGVRTLEIKCGLMTSVMVFMCCIELFHTLFCQLVVWELLCLFWNYCSGKNMITTHLFANTLNSFCHGAEFTFLKHYSIQIVIGFVIYLIFDWILWEWSDREIQEFLHNTMLIYDARLVSLNLILWSFSVATLPEGYISWQL